MPLKKKCGSFDIGSFFRYRILNFGSEYHRLTPHPKRKNLIKTLYTDNRSQEQKHYILTTEVKNRNIIY